MQVDATRRKRINKYRREKCSTVVVVVVVVAVLVFVTEFGKIRSTNDVML